MTTTELNIPNLTKLRDYLLTLPEDYTHFEMSVFATKGDIDLDMPLTCDEAINLVNVCDSAACAIGHAPSAGIPLDSEFCTLDEIYDEMNDEYVNLRVVRWGAFSNANLCSTDTAEWDFMFGPYWTNVDNTPSGAAKRIGYVLEHGKVPDGFVDPERAWVRNYERVLY